MDIEATFVSPGFTSVVAVSELLQEQNAATNTQAKIFLILFGLIGE